MMLFVKNDLNDKLTFDTVIDNFVVIDREELNYNY